MCLMATRSAAAIDGPQSSLIQHVRSNDDLSNVTCQNPPRATLTHSSWLAGEMALVASVLGTSVTQQQLVPALMRVYGEADFVVGLDVDVDSYDKFGVSNKAL